MCFNKLVQLFIHFLVCNHLIHPYFNRFLHQLLCDLFEAESFSFCKLRWIFILNLILSLIFDDIFLMMLHLFISLCLFKCFNNPLCQYCFTLLRFLLLTKNTTQFAVPLGYSCFESVCWLLCIILFDIFSITFLTTCLIIHVLWLNANNYRASTEWSQIIGKICFIDLDLSIWDSRRLVSLLFNKLDRLVI